MSASNLRTPLGKVRGLGAAKSGTTEFIASRVTSIALSPLCVWLVISAAVNLDGGYESAVAWAARPLNAVLLILLVVASFYHMGGGMRVIVEDYIHKNSTKALLLLGNVFLWTALTAASVFAIVKISVGS